MKLGKKLNWDSVKAQTNKAKFGVDAAIDALLNLDSSCDIKDDYGLSFEREIKSCINWLIGSIDAKLKEGNSSQVQINIKKLRIELIEFKMEMCFTETSKIKIKIRQDRFLELYQKTCSVIFTSDKNYIL